MCRKLLSQPYIGPIYAMLLYQWLLGNKDAGGAEQRQKHINLLAAGLALNTCVICWYLWRVMADVLESLRIPLLNTKQAHAGRVHLVGSSLFWAAVSD